MSTNLCCMVFSVLFSLCVILYALFLGNYEMKENCKESANITPGPRSTSTLKFLIVISRHGNRRMFGFSNDPYPMNDTSYWPYETGELTTHGRIQMFKLGKKIRSLYDGYLNRDYGTSEMHASSTKMDRTVMSAQVFLAGLYPPQGVYIWNKDIPWQPIPIYTDSLDNTPRVMQCGAFLDEMAKAFDKHNLEYGMQLQAVDSYLSEYAGILIFEDFSFFYVWDALYSEDIEGYKLPDWSKEVYPEPMRYLAEKIFICVFGGSDQLVRITLGQFTNQMMGVMKSKLNGTLSPDKKMYYYSGHDASLVDLQLVLGIPRADVIGMPNPGSAMIFEIHQNPNSSVHTVQVLFIDGGSSNLDPFELNIPDCPHPCEFTKLAEITSKFENVTDFEEECKQLINFNKHYYYYLLFILPLI